MSLLSYIKDVLFGENQDEGLSGIEAVQSAYQEIQSIQGNDLTATIGEPDLLPSGGEFFSEPKVAIPVEDAPMVGSQTLVFDFPYGETEAGEVFVQLLDAFDTDMDNLGEIEGEEVPVAFIGGNLNVDWHKAGVNSEDQSDNVAEDQNGDSSVKVEETTISAGPREGTDSE